MRSDAPDTRLWVPGHARLPSDSKLYGRVSLERRVDAYLQHTMAGMLLDLFSAFLAVLTIVRARMAACVPPQQQRRRRIHCSCKPSLQQEKLPQDAGESELGSRRLLQMTYIVETVYTRGEVYRALTIVDLACSCIFTAEWVFWLWLAKVRGCPLCRRSGRAWSVREAALQPGVPCPPALLPDGVC
jgi:hypothetical protein